MHNYYSMKILEEHTKHRKCFAGSKLLKFVLVPNKDPNCCFKDTLVQI